MQSGIGKTRMTAAVVIVLLMAFVMIMPTVLVNAAVKLPDVDNEKFGSIPGPLPTGVVVGFTHPTEAILSFTPNPIGFGQQLLVNAFLTPPLPNPQFHTGYQFIFTKPDGTKETVVKNSFRADTTTWFNYVPDQVGTWTLEFVFLGSYFPPGNYSTVEGSWITPAWYSFPQGSYYSPSSAGPFNFTVQADYVMSWPPAPLPSDYWTRPVSPENREWMTILGWYPSAGLVGGSDSAYHGDWYAWPDQTNKYMNIYQFTPYVQAPNTAHVVWRRQGGIGGLTGGTMGVQSVSSGSGGAPTIVYAGRCYQTVTRYDSAGNKVSLWECYDLRTGQVYWDQNMTGKPIPNIVMTYAGVAHETGSTHMSARGVYLGAVSGGRLIQYSPNDGAVYQNISISPLTSATFYNDPFFLSVYNMGNTTVPKYRLINWSLGFDYGAGGSMINIGMRVATNISWPMSSMGTVDYETGVAVFTNSISVNSLSSTDWAGTPPIIDTLLTAYNLLTGALMWNKTTGIQYMISSGSTAVADQGRFAVRFEDGLFHCWDLRNGDHLWKQELTSYPWGRYGSYNIASYGGVLFATQYDGVVAVNWTDGTIAWRYHNEAPYSFETPYQNYYPFFTGVEIADGKVYAYNSEHTPTQPLTRGWQLHCINFTTGEGIWNITGSMSPGAIADGYLTASCSYDSYMYVFGKGQSATTVSAPDTAVAKGTAVLIKGTVMDMSPGDQGSITNPTARLDSTTKAGTVPCVDVSSMTTQMEYLYLQRPIDGLNHDQIMTGVPVTLTAIGSDGSVTVIGTTTTNGYYGTFSMPWTPPNEGTYTIIASFAGDDSYGSSSGATSLSVGPAPASQQAIEIPTPVDYTMTIVYAAIAIIIAVVIAVAVAVILLRRRA
jgi:hypothetical protein